jgi:hypothetical protein
MIPLKSQRSLQLSGDGSPTLSPPQLASRTLLAYVRDGAAGSPRLMRALVRRRQQRAAGRQAALCAMRLLVTALGQPPFEGAALTLGVLSWSFFGMIFHISHNSVPSF